MSNDSSTLTKYFKRIRPASSRTQQRWRRKFEYRLRQFDERQTLCIERYAESVRLHVAYLDEMTKKTGVDHRVGFAEYLLSHPRERK